MRRQTFQVASPSSVEHHQSSRAAEYLRPPASKTISGSACKGAPAAENPLWPVNHTGVVGGPHCRPPTRVPKGDLLARSLGFHAMLSEQAVERLPIYSSCVRGPGDVARVAIERAAQIRCFEQIHVLSLGGAERQFA
jgi:hypothetical protein